MEEARKRLKSFAINVRMPQNDEIFSWTTHMCKWRKSRSGKCMCLRLRTVWLMSSRGGTLRNSERSKINGVSALAARNSVF